MSKKEIENMLERFMKGATSEQEEQQLAEFFRTCSDIPAEWKEYAAMFKAFELGEPSFSEEEMESLAQMAASEPEHKRRVMPLWLSIAVILAAMTAIPLAATAQLPDVEIPAGFEAGFDGVLKNFAAAKSDKACDNFFQMKAKEGEEFVWNGKKLVAEPDDNAKQPTFLSVATYINPSDKVKRRTLLIHHTINSDGSIKGMTIDYQYFIISEENKKAAFPKGIEAEHFPSTLSFWRDYEVYCTEWAQREMAEYYAKRNADPQEREALEQKTVLKTFNNLESKVRGQSNFNNIRTDAALSIYLLVKESKEKMDENDSELIKTQIYHMITEYDKTQHDKPENATILNYLRMAYKLF